MTPFPRVMTPFAKGHGESRHNKSRRPTAQPNHRPKGTESSPIHRAFKLSLEKPPGSQPSGGASVSELLQAARRLRAQARAGRRGGSEGTPEQIQGKPIVLGYLPHSFQASFFPKRAMVAKNGEITPKKCSEFTFGLMRKNKSIEGETDITLLFTWTRPPLSKSKDI